MRSDAHRCITAAITVLLALAGCTSTTSGSPTGTPAPQSSSGGSPTSSESDVPRIQDPLDAADYVAAPCSVLRADQLSAFGAGEGEEHTTGAAVEQFGPYCSWLVPEKGSSIAVGFLTVVGGMESVYAIRDGFSYFEPAQVLDYPAVFAGEPDLRDSGSCSLIVGVSDTIAFRASEEGFLDRSGSCERAKQVAQAALETMGAGN